MTFSSTMVFLKGLQLNNRILELIDSLNGTDFERRKLILSFDLYCLLVEYFIILYHESENIEEMLSGLLAQDALQVEVGNAVYSLEIDFFAHPNTIIVS
jgi:hypothetical protein